MFTEPPLYPAPAGRREHRFRDSVDVSFLSTGIDLRMNLSPPVLTSLLVKWTRFNFTLLRQCQGRLFL